MHIVKENNYMDKKIYDAYVAILKTELVPALGCTEPIAIAFAAAKARDVLGSFPEKIRIEASGNIVKNRSELRRHERNRCGGDARSGRRRR